VNFSHPKVANAKAPINESLVVDVGETMALCLLSPLVRRSLNAFVVKAFGELNVTLQV
jgi:hypothetical protein